jgi:hypothetical protein
MGFKKLIAGTPTPLANAQSEEGVSMTYIELDCKAEIDAQQFWFLTLGAP